MASSFCWLHPSGVQYQFRVLCGMPQGYGPVAAAIDECIEEDAAAMDKQHKRER